VIALLLAGDEISAMCIHPQRSATRHIQNFLACLLSYILKVERRISGFFFWLGRGRVSWGVENKAMLRILAQQAVEAA
jgi:hypothetical protein